MNFKNKSRGKKETTGKPNKSKHLGQQIQYTQFLKYPLFLSLGQNKKLKTTTLINSTSYFYWAYSVSHPSPSLFLQWFTALLCNVSPGSKESHYRWFLCADFSSVNQQLSSLTDFKSLLQLGWDNLQIEARSRGRKESLVPE